MAQEACRRSLRLRLQQARLGKLSFLRLLRQPRQGLSAADRGVGRPGRASRQEEALSAELGEAYQQGVGGRSQLHLVQPGRLDGVGSPIPSIPVMERRSSSSTADRTGPGIGCTSTARVGH